MMVSRHGRGGRTGAAITEFPQRGRGERWVAQHTVMGEEETGVMRVAHKLSLTPGGAPPLSSTHSHWEVRGHWARSSAPLNTRVTGTQTGKGLVHIA